MPFRPTALDRKNIPGVIYPLTAAIRQIYGVRSDGAWPIGAFYTVNIDLDVWRSVGGIWYVPRDASQILSRSINEGVIAAFCDAIENGNVVVLPSGSSVTWEAVPNDAAAQLP